ncbi:unnamed protein product [Ectocarpus sp. 12 AP-2014]
MLVWYMYPSNSCYYEVDTWSRSYCLRVRFRPLCLVCVIIHRKQPLKWEISYTRVTATGSAAKSPCLSRHRTTLTLPSKSHAACHVLHVQHLGMYDDAPSCAV